MTRNVVSKMKVCPKKPGKGCLNRIYSLFQENLNEQKEIIPSDSYYAFQLIKCEGVYVMK